MEKWVWASHDSHGLIPAKVHSSKGSKIVLETIEAEKLSVSKEQVDSFDLATESSIHGIYENLADLEEFSNGALLHQLRKRYSKQLIYTWIGHILVSINPYELLPLYTASHLDRYVSSRDVSSLPAHIFGIANKAFRSIQAGEGSQAFIISGESGAGKTEATKLILQFLSEAASRTFGESRSEDSGSLEQTILQTNPLLESFGNSKTVRNNNSSRFGKWMEITFGMDDNRLRIVGASIINYLLEKSRVVSVASEERTYHIFYQLVQGVEDDELRKRYKLRNVEWYRNLSSSGCLHVSGVSDSQEFEKTLSAMKTVGMSPEDQDQIFKVLSAILILGNLRFIRHPHVDEGSLLQDNSLSAEAAELLGIEHALLEQSLMFRKMSVSNSVHYIPLNVTDASTARDTLCKDLYGRLFDWIIEKTNEGLSLQNQVTYNGSSDRRVMGVLDIFGFEIFQHNSFEQFSINYTNEKLQQYFTAHMFKMEQEEYRSEGIQLDFIDFVDNADCLELIEGKTGILSVLNEQVVMPKGSDQKALQKLHDSFAHPKKEHPRYSMIKQQKDSLFVIHHYAGEVVYNINGFLEKNRDRSNESANGCLKNSSIELVESLYVTESKMRHNRSRACSVNIDPCNIRQRSRSSSVGPPTLLSIPGKVGSSSKKHQKKSLKSQTICGKFSEQLKQLVEVLEDSQPHFIRCIKPNESKVPQSMDSCKTLHQMRYAGLLEAIRVRAMGYSARYLKGEFVSKYAMLMQDSLKMKKKGKTELPTLEELLEYVSKRWGMLNGDFAIGLTKVFCKAHAALILENAREEIVANHALSLQRIGRSFLAKKEAGRRRKRLQECEAALRDNDAESLKRIISKCEDENLYFGVLKQAKDRLNELNKRKSALNEVQNAVASNDMDRLEEALQKAQALGCGSDKIVEKAKSTLSDIRSVQELKQRIARCIEEEDVNGLKEAINDPVSSRIPQTELMSAQVVFRKLSKEQKIFDQMDYCREEGDLDGFLRALELLKGVSSFLGERGQRKEQEAKSWALNYVQDLTALFTQKGNKDELESLLKIVENSVLQDSVPSIQEAIVSVEQAAIKMAEPQLEESQAISGKIQDKIKKGLGKLSIRIAKGNVKSRTNAFENKMVEQDEEIARRHTKGNIPPRKKSNPAIQSKISQLAEKWKGFAPKPSDPPPRKLSQGTIKDTLGQLRPTGPPPGPPPRMPRKDSLLPGELETTLKQLSDTRNNQISAVEQLRTALNRMDRSEIRQALINARDQGVGDCPEIKQARHFCHGMDENGFMLAKLAMYVMEERPVSELTPLVQEISRKGIKYAGNKEVETAFSKVEKEKNALKSKRKSKKQQIFIPYRNHQDAIKEVIRSHTSTVGSIPMLRSEESFFKKVWIKKHRTGQWCYSSKNIPKSLIDFRKISENSSVSKELEKKSKHIFHNILYYQEVQFHAYPNTAAMEIVKTGLEEPVLRDEIYLQLIKQTTKPQEEELEERKTNLAFKLLFMCLYQFLPENEHVQELLETHLCNWAAHEISRFSPFEISQNTASFCFEALRRAYSEGYSDKDILTLENIADISGLSGTKMTLWYQGEELALCLNIIPGNSRKMFPFERLKGPITAQDLSLEVARIHHLSFQGKISIQEAPEVVEMKLEDEGRVDNDSNVEEFVELCRDSSAKWILHHSSEKVSPISFIVGSNTAINLLSKQ